MKKLLAGTLILFVTSLVLFPPVAHSKKSSATRKIQKVAFVALAKDTIRASEIEIAVKEDLLKAGVSADSLRVIAKDWKGDADTLATFIREQGYDSLLCMGPRKTIRITAADKAGGFPTLHNCLSTYLTGNYPSGEPLEVDPVLADGPPASSGEQGSSRTPIPTNPTAVAMNIFKGTLRVFDASTTKIIWEGSLQAKMPADLRSGLETKAIVYGTMSALKDSGILPDNK